MLLIDSHNGKSNWVSQVKQLLEMTGFGHVWLNSGVENDGLFLNNAYATILDRQLIWNCTSRGTFYVLYNDLFKNNINYLDVVKTQHHRVALTRLRTSDHRLTVESGRWHRPHVLPLMEENVVAVTTWRTSIIFYLSFQCILNHVGNIYLNTIISVQIC